MRMALYPLPFLALWVPGGCSLCSRESRDTGRGEPSSRGRSCCDLETFPRAQPLPSQRAL